MKIINHGKRTKLADVRSTSYPDRPMTCFTCLACLLQDTKFHEHLVFLQGIDKAPKFTHLQQVTSSAQALRREWRRPQKLLLESLGHHRAGAELLLAPACRS